VTKCLFHLILDILLSELHMRSQVFAGDQVFERMARVTGKVFVMVAMR
jgi:hypothetical protein